MLPALQEQDPWPSLDELVAHDNGSPTTLWLGRRDLPKEQRQDELAADLRRGGLCLIGPNRSGITTALTTVAEAFARQVAPGTRGTVISFDAANHLRAELDQRFANAVSLSMTRLDEVTRCIDQLWLRIRRHLERLSDSADADPQPREAILLLIDGFEVLMRALSAPGGVAVWAGRLAEVLTLGRRAGIYSCISVRGVRDLDRSIITSQATIISLQGHYEDAGTPQEDRRPGFGLDPDGNLVQFFVPAAANPASRFAFDPALAAAFAADRWRQSAVTLPPGRTDLVVGLGIDEIDHNTICVSLIDSQVLVVGAPRSGRTKLLLTLADQLARQAGAPAAYFSPRGLPAGAWSPNIAIVTADQLLELGKISSPGQRAAWLANLGVAQLKDGRIVLLADDSHAVELMENGNTLSQLLPALYRQSLIQPIAVATPTSFSGSNLGSALKTTAIAVHVKPTADPSEFDSGHRVRNVRLRHRPGVIYKKGDVIIQTDDAQHVAHLPELAETVIVP